MEIAAQALVSILVAIVGGLVGFLAAYRQNLLNEIRNGFQELERLRAAPLSVKWRPYDAPPSLQIVECPEEPGDDEWMESVVGLKGLASVLRDDELYGLVELIQVDLERYVRIAKSFTIDDDTRYRNKEETLSNLQGHLPAAESRLSEWLSLWSWLKFIIRFRKRKPIDRRRFVSG